MIERKKIIKKKHSNKTGYLGRNQIAFLGIQKTGYPVFRIPVDSVSGFEHL